MQWTTFVLGGRSLTHVEQDANTNQCVAASLAMVCKNAGYWGHSFGEGALFSHGASAMRKANSSEFTKKGASGISDKAFISANGIRHNAVALYLRGYGFGSISTVSLGTNGAATVAQTINTMKDGDSAILACGGNAFHALAAFKRKGTLYVLNPMPGQPGDRGFAYPHKNAVKVVGDSDTENVVFEKATYGDEYWRSVDACFLIPSQSYLGTVKRWIFG